MRLSKNPRRAIGGSAARGKFDPDKMEAFSQDPVRVAEGDPMRATIDLFNPLHLAILAREIARIRRGSVGSSLTLPREDWNEIAERFLSTGGQLRRPLPARGW